MNPPPWQVVIRVVVLLALCGWAWNRMNAPPSPEAVAEAPEEPTGFEADLAGPPQSDAPAHIDPVALLDATTRMADIGSACGAHGSPLTLTFGPSGLTHLSLAREVAAGPCIVERARAVAWPSAQSAVQTSINVP